MSFQRTSIFMNADDRKIVSALQKRYGLSTMSETIRFALRIATTFVPQESHRLIPFGLFKPANHSEQVHQFLAKTQRIREQVEYRITTAQRINQRVEDRIRFNEALLAQRQTRLREGNATQAPSPGASGGESQ